MKIRHFGGIEFAACENELTEILTQRYGNNVNEFWITEDDQNNPCLAILVNKELANITYFPDEYSPGAQSAGGGCGLEPNGYTVFYTNTPEEEIEISNNSIVPFDLALKAAAEFYHNQKMPRCIDWTDN